MSDSYKMDEKHLESIIHINVRSEKVETKINLLIYYKNKKLRNLLINHKPMVKSNDVENQHHVVYQYQCNRDGCNSAKYIGYTSTTLWQRFAQHQSVRKHLLSVHKIKTIPRRQLLADVSVLKKCPSRRDLVLTEALLIKSEKLSLNSQEEGSIQILKIFKH